MHNNMLISLSVERALLIDFTACRFKLACLVARNSEHVRIVMQKTLLRCTIFLRGVELLLFCA